MYEYPSTQYAAEKQRADKYMGADVYGQTINGASLGPKQSPALFQHIASLERAIHNLRDSLGQLGERLLPVSYPTPVPEGLATGQGLKVGSPIAGRLNELEATIQDMNRRVQTQLESMDL